MRSWVASGSLSNIKLALPWITAMCCGIGAALVGGLLITFGTGHPVVIASGVLCLVHGVTAVAICVVISSALPTFLQTFIYRYATGVEVPGIDPRWLPLRQQS